MPTYNNIDYLSMPEQVNKNKADIAALEARVAALETLTADLLARIEVLEAAA